jgi:hypothetical protein
VGSIFLLFLSLKPVKGFLIFAIINAMFAALMLLPQYASNPIRDIIVAISLSGQFFLIAPIAYTQIIFSAYYN